MTVRAKPESCRDDAELQPPELRQRPSTREARVQPHTAPPLPSFGPSPTSPPPPPRYRGLAKTHLQHVLTALAINLVRVDAWLTGAATTGSWTSRLARLSQPLPAT